MHGMNGKKFVMIFVGLIFVFGAAASIWMKHAYDTRPNIKIEEIKK